MPGPSPRPPLRVGLLGAGTVGSAVARAFLERPERLAPFDGARLVLAGVAVRDHGRAAAGGIPEDLLTDAPAHLVASPEVDVVVELIGGDEPARTLIAAALAAGKPVVTANKHVIAHHGPALEALARSTGTPLRFEAAVGAGIPILGALAGDLAANRIDRVRGIVNGTTNFILSAMAERRRAYEAVLADAQRAGYAEADPAGDVEGDDALNKLVILARLAFGSLARDRPRSNVARRPPTAWAGRDQRGDRRGGHGRGAPWPPAQAARRRSPGERARRRSEAIEARVQPVAVPADSGLGRTGGVVNRVEVDASPLGRLELTGPGAGGGPTSSAVLGDLIAIARGGGSTWAGLPPASERAIAAPGRRRPAPALVLPVGPARPADPRPARPGGWRPADGFITTAAAARGAAGRPGGAGHRRDALSDRGSPHERPDQARAPSPARPRLVERYRAFLPITDATPRLTLGEGFTPLVRLNRIGATLGLPALYAKVEGQNPTGSFKDRGMVVAVAKAIEAGARALICASTGNTSASAAAYGAAAGLEVVVVLPRGQIAAGKLLQAQVAGARVVAIEGNFDQALRVVRELAESPAHPITLVNSVNPHRLEGQKTGCLRGLRRPRAGARRPGHPGRQRRQHQCLLGRASATTGRRASSPALPRMFGFQAAGAAPIVLGHRVEAPETIATAIRIGDPASWAKATAARDESGGLIEAVTDDQILAAWRDLAREEGIFCEPSSAAGLAGISRLAGEGRLDPSATIVCVLTGSGLKDPKTAEANVGRADRGRAIGGQRDRCAPMVRV